MINLGLMQLRLNQYSLIEFYVNVNKLITNYETIASL